MKQNLMVIIVVLVSVCYTTIAFATDVKPMNIPAEKKITPPGAKKNKLLDRNKIKADGGITSTGGGDSTEDQDPAESSASMSKQAHDTAEKVIDNLK